MFSSVAILHLFSFWMNNIFVQVKTFETKNVHFFLIIIFCFIVQVWLLMICLNNFLVKYDKYDISDKKKKDHLKTNIKHEGDCSHCHFVTHTSAPGIKKLHKYPCVTINITIIWIAQTCGVYASSSGGTNKILCNSCKYFQDFTFLSSC